MVVVVVVTAVGLVVVVEGCFEESSNDKSVWVF